MNLQMDDWNWQVDVQVHYLDYYQGYSLNHDYLDCIPVAMSEIYTGKSCYHSKWFYSYLYWMDALKLHLDLKISYIKLVLSVHRRHLSYGWPGCCSPLDNGLFERSVYKVDFLEINGTVASERSRSEGSEFDSPRGGAHIAMDGVLSSHLAATGSILGLEIYRQCCCLEMWTAEAY